MSVESYFQQRAEQFDALYVQEAGLRGWFNRRFRAGLYERAELAIKETSSMSQPTVLDVGCGSGRNSVLFAKAGAQSVVGIDLAGKMIALANGLAQDCNTSAQTRFICGDFMQHEFQDKDKFDAAIALGVFDYVADPVPVLRRMARFAKLKVIASFPAATLVRARLRKLRYGLRGCPVYFYSEGRLRQILAEAGFEHFKIVPYASAGLLVVADVNGN